MAVGKQEKKKKNGAPSPDGIYEAAQLVPFSNITTDFSFLPASISSESEVVEESVRSSTSSSWRFLERFFFFFDFSLFFWISFSAFACAARRY
jgi:hypothetical protein